MRTTTVVTALFDIGRDTWEYYTLAQSMYLGWYRNTLSLNTNHVIYTDEVYYDKILEILKEHGTSKNVRVYVKKLKDLPAYQLYHEKLNVLMMSEAFKKQVSFQVPEMLYPLYNIIMFNKMFFLADAIENNPFDSDDFIWADAGGLREDIKFYKGVVWPNQEKIDILDKSKILMFSHHAKISILVPHDHALSQMRFIQGTSFFLTKDCISKLINIFNKKVNECIDAGYIGSDEKIFDFCYLECPELFQLEVSSWREYFDRYK